MITWPNKGGGVFILNREEYINKVANIPTDTTKFEILTENCFKLNYSIDDKSQKLVRKLKIFKFN